MHWKYAIGLLLMCLHGMSHGNSLYVFVPTEVKTNVVQEKIQAVCPAVNTTVFGRAKDFNSQLKSAPPEAVLTMLPVIERQSGFDTVLNGEKNGNAFENYVLVAIDREVSLEAIGEMKIGVLDLLGRKPMNEFVGQLLQTKVKLKRVSKIEDLLPLMSFKAADALFVSTSVYESLQKQSQLNLVAKQLDIQIGLVSAAVNGTQSSSEITACINQFQPELNKILGVESWAAN